ncbi:hypothetical protein [Methylococcus sp. EFPC2]|uniref:hypothetical protein n=1 Tax=Methylococcus sp. EFPC2 TaxID=2812648 RepID=UPI0019688C84|nr:hypothetical protein [Methylococcus sp. EFPC2]QSA97910.1 hypothetical protein JWZ97_03515 [Methylococcus sp. EFPC2]
MHFLLLMLLAPFGVLFGVFGLIAALLGASLLVEFPLIAMAVIGLVLLALIVPKLRKPGELCHMA